MAAASAEPPRMDIGLPCPCRPVPHMSSMASGCKSGDLFIAVPHHSAKPLPGKCWSLDEFVGSNTGSGSSAPITRALSAEGQHPCAHHGHFPDEQIRSRFMMAAFHEVPVGFGCKARSFETLAHCEVLARFPLPLESL
mmetsp:Transcript_11988/g.25324  ORF Transcript_11988/g.25324 Transcript_11988/m.25324 type:complete len:138 (+) Transcript_11988:507-920(+)